MLSSLFLLSFHPFYEVQFFFINRIFKNDLISDCLCALNHVVGPVHKSVEGQGEGKTGLPAKATVPMPCQGCGRMERAGVERGTVPTSLSGTFSHQIQRCQEEVCLLTRTPRAAGSPFSS